MSQTDYELAKLRSDFEFAHDLSLLMIGLCFHMMGYPPVGYFCIFYVIARKVVKLFSEVFSKKNKA